MVVVVETLEHYFKCFNTDREVRRYKLRVPKATDAYNYRADL